VRVCVWSRNPPNEEALVKKGLLPPPPAPPKKQTNQKTVHYKAIGPVLRKNVLRNKYAVTFSTDKQFWLVGISQKVLKGKTTAV